MAKTGKKSLALLLAALMLLSIMPLSTLFAGADYESPFTFEIYQGWATITDVDEDVSGEVTVPEKLGGFEVFAIGNQAFSNCTQITSVTLPDTLRVINDYAFGNCQELKSINFPESLLYIGMVAFEDCYKLESVNIPAGVAEMGDDAFLNCESLTEIKVAPENPCYSSEDGVLFNNEKGELIKYPAGSTRTNYDIPNSVYYILPSAFEFSTNLVQVTLPDNITWVENGTFEGCTSLKDITIPYGVTWFGYYAFSGCSSLKTVTLPRSVRYIEADAFLDCPSITDVYYSGSLNDWNSIQFSDGNDDFKNATPHCQEEFKDEDLSFTYIVYDGNATITSYWGTDTEVTVPAVIGDENFPVNVIGDDSFYNSAITNIDIPDSVTTIGSRAFLGCTSLLSIDIPHSVTYIGEDAFCYCYALEEAIIGNGVEFIGPYAFYNCPALNSLTIGNSVTYIGYEAFCYCESLTNLVLPDSVTYLDECVFEECYGLQDVTIGDGVVHIGHGAFKDCIGLVNLTLGENVSFIGNGAFYNCNLLENLVILDSVTYIGREAFCGCYELESLTLGENVSFIGNGAFYNCNLLEKLVIPNSVTYIGDQAFCYCNALNNLTLGNSVDYLGNWAFCRGAYTSVAVPKSVTYIGRGSFGDCANLTEITVDEENPNYSSKNGVIFNKDKTALEQYPNGNVRTQYDIPRGVQTVYSGAFYNADNFTHLSVPKSLTGVEGNAFYDCSAFTNVYYEGQEADWINIGIEPVGNEPLINAEREYATVNNENGFTYLLYGGEAIITDVDETMSGEVEIPETLGGHPVTGIGDGAFSDCNSITKLTIPDSITDIGDNAFDGCDGFTDVYYEGTEAQWNAVTGTEALAGKTIHFAEDPDDPEDPGAGDYANAKLPGTPAQTARYKNNVTVKITATGIPANGFLVVDGTKIASDATGTATFEAEFQAKEGKTFKAHIEDENGNVKVAEQEYKVNVDTGFFAKLVAFFMDFIFNGFKWKKVAIEF